MSMLTTARKRTLSRLSRVPALVKLRQTVERRLPDMEIRQLHALREAYAGPTGPDVLLFGDSAMFWTRGHETDLRTLAVVIRDELPAGLTIHTVAGPGYNARVVSAFLGALATTPSKPKVVVVPTSLLMAATSWISHPLLGYEHEAPALAKLAAAPPGDETRRLPRAGMDDWNKFDHMPAPSLFGAKRTVGEVRMITNAIPANANARPTTNWQQVIRVRHILDLSNAETLTPESPGVRYVAELGSTLAGLGVASVAYIPPVNHEVVAKMFKPAAVDHVRRNSDVVETAFRQAAGPKGDVVVATFLSPASEFSDPLHLNDEGRLRFARAIAGAVTARLDGEARQPK